MLGSDYSTLSSFARSVTFSPVQHLNFAPPQAEEHSESRGARHQSASPEEQDQLILSGRTLERLKSMTREKEAPVEMRPGGKELTPEEQEEVEALEERDREVRRHEQAHFQAGGKYANPPKYEYQTGPDGKRYAVGGSVNIDTSEISDDPRATLEKARVIKRAALAPEEPSAQDRKVAREADRMASEAQQKLSEERISRNGEQTSAAEGEEVAGQDGLAASIDAVKDFATMQVSQYKTARLEMSFSRDYSVERLAMPRQPVFQASRLAGIDVYV